MRPHPESYPAHGGLSRPQSPGEHSSVPGIGAPPKGLPYLDGEPRKSAERSLARRGTRHFVEPAEVKSRWVYSDHMCRQSRIKHTAA